MNQAALAWHAFRNMLHAAARDPLWAVAALCMSPFHAIPVVLGGAVFLIVVTLAVNFGLVFLFYLIGIDGHPAARMVINIAVPLVVLGLLFRLITNPLILHFGNMAGDTHGSARFATEKETAPLTRTGKGVGTIIPNLLTADRSVICIDPKGENARIAGRARQSFGPVHVLDPFGVTGQSAGGQTSAAFNPLVAAKLAYYADPELRGLYDTP